MPKTKVCLCPDALKSRGTQKKNLGKKNFQFPDSDHDKERRRKKTITPKLDKRCEQNRFLEGRHLPTYVLCFGVTWQHQAHTWHPKTSTKGAKGPVGHPPVLRAEMRERSTDRPESLPAPPTAPTPLETQQGPRFGTRTPGLCPDLSRPLTSDLHISLTDKDQTEAHTPQPQKPRTGEQRNKAVIRGATWRRPDGLPLPFPPSPFGLSIPQKSQSQSQSLRSNRKFQIAIHGKSLNGGLAHGGLRYFSTIVHDCLWLSSFWDESFPQKRAQKTAKVHNCTRLCANCREWP